MEKWLHKGCSNQWEYSSLLVRGVVNINLTLLN